MSHTPARPRRRRLRPRLYCLALAIVASAVAAPLLPSEADALAPRLKLTPVEREPPAGRVVPSAATLAKLRSAVHAKPRDRQSRFELVMALMRASKLQDALTAARAWRRHDAYNLVVVRLIGDIYAQLGKRAEATRAYSAVVELLPKSADAQRALATVMKQAGQLRGAYARLSAALLLRPKDSRIAFELADTAQRLGLLTEAEKRFRAIIDSTDAPRNISHPSKQRLAQIYARQRNAALARKDSAKAKALAASIAKLAVEGGAVNDIKVYLTWDTNRTDVDLWVTNPKGEKVYYSHRRGSLGGALFGDVTNGYGPESFTASSAAKGQYVIQVHYYGTRRRAFREARGEVVVVLDEGRPHERRYVLPYRLFRPKQVVTVARVRVTR